MSEPDDRRLRACFREIHDRIDDPPPPYGSLLRPARRLRPVRAGAALAAALGVVVVTGALLLVALRRPARRAGDDEALRLASELVRWEAPTDFLLETPGIEWLRTSPRFGAGKDDLPGETPGPTGEEVLR